MGVGYAYGWRKNKAGADIISSKTNIYERLHGASMGCSLMTLWRSTGEE